VAAVIAAVAMGDALDGELETSLPPCVVPTEAETAFANVGVRFTVAPYNGFVGDEVIEAVGANITVTVVVADLVTSSFDDAVIVTAPAVLGAFQTPVLAFIVPALTDQATPPVAPPLVVAVKVVELFTVRVGEAGLMGFTVTVWGVTTEDSAVAVWPGVLMTVSVNVVGAVMARDALATLLVTAPTPWLTLPVPLAKSGVRFTVAPKSGLVVLGVRLVAMGST